MMTQDTLNKLQQMKLAGMATGFNEQMMSSNSLHLSFEERFGMLVDQELTYRENNRLKRLLKAAKLRESACMEDIDYRSGRGIDRSEMASLALCQWINQGLNLVLGGPAGVGKTWLACAFGNQACRKGLSVIFQRLPLLLEDLALSHADGSFHKRLTQLAKVDLLILDDFGIAAMSASSRNDLLEVLDQRSGRKSTLMTSQLPMERWHEYLSGGNLTVADAILDRLLSGSQRINLQGESMRKHRSNKKP
ncbi:IS21-like element helper ATPase IstB [Methylophilus sp. YYY-1]|uniref:IS21-like element helper ATPase IstB n=1 Tax=Methylophilus sp. YYY-1 TaxID=2682087 RepID=UPI0023B24772|nr:IS21-like element helper ATPase IstB [Methylophilus sp. YYY-1]MDF0379023.1 AAA family ATPase [Methylophilus sp. YYY-1]